MILKQYEPADRALPILVQRSSYEGTASDLVRAHVHYFNSLLRAGFGVDSMPLDFQSLFLLDFMVAQVSNGGLSQYVHNCHDKLHNNLDHAVRGAELLGNHALAKVAKDCRDWCHENPQEAAAQTGFDVRADYLNGLDKIFDPWFTEEELTAYFQKLPVDLAAHLRSKVFYPKADALIVTLRQQANDALNEGKPLEQVKRIAKSAAADYLKFSATRKEFTLHEPELFVKITETAIEQAIDILAVEGGSRPQSFETVLGKALYPRFRFERSKYTIFAHMWLVQHPNLIVVADEAYQDRLDEILTACPFAALEYKARKLDQLVKAVPGKNAIAFARALPKPFLGIWGRRPLIETHSLGLEGIISKDRRRARAQRPVPGRILLSDKEISLLFASQFRNFQSQRRNVNPDF